MGSRPTFDEIPQMLLTILEKLEILEQSIKKTSPILETEYIEDKPLSISEVSDLYKVSRQTLYSWIKEGVIHPGFTIKGRRFWYKSQLKEFDLQNK